MGIFILVLAGMLWNQKRQVRDICRQLAFLKEHESNLLITRNTDAGGIGELTEELNDLLIFIVLAFRLTKALESDLVEEVLKSSNDLLATSLLAFISFQELLSLLFNSCVFVPISWLVLVNP